MRVNSLVFRVGVVCMGVYRCGFPVIMIYAYVFCVVWWYCMNVFLFLFLFLVRFFAKNRNSVISVNSFKMCSTRYYRRDFCTKITGTRYLCLCIPCTCFQIVFINHCYGFYWGAIKSRIIIILFFWLINRWVPPIRQHYIRVTVLCTWYDRLGVFPWWLALVIRVSAYSGWIFLGLVSFWSYIYTFWAVI